MAIKPKSDSIQYITNHIYTKLSGGDNAKSNALALILYYKFNLKIKFVEKVPRTKRRKHNYLVKKIRITS